MPTIHVPWYNQVAAWLLPLAPAALGGFAWYSGAVLGGLLLLAWTALLVLPALSTARRSVAWGEDGFVLQGLRRRSVEWGQLEEIGRTYQQGHSGLRLRIAGRLVHYGLSMFRAPDAARFRKVIEERVAERRSSR